jgi:hypothetical protein
MGVLKVEADGGGEDVSDASPWAVPDHLVIMVNGLVGRYVCICTPSCLVLSLSLSLSLSLFYEFLFYLFILSDLIFRIIEDFECELMCSIG